MSPVRSVDNGLEILLQRMTRSRRHLLLAQPGVIGLHLYLVTRGQEGVEAHYKLGVTLEQHRDPGDHAGSVD